MTYYEEWKLPLCNARPTITITTSIQPTQGKKMLAQVLQIKKKFEEEMNNSLREDERQPSKKRPKYVF